MDPISIAALVASGAFEVLKLVNEAVETSRAGNEAGALAKLDEALTKFEAAMPGTRAELEAVKARVAKRLQDKFHPPAPDTSK